jgi:hypothetical protein
MTDLVEQGHDGPSGPPRWLRVSVAAAVVAVAAVAMFRSDLLSAAKPPAHPGASQQAPVVGVVVREGERLERYVPGHRVRLATLPSRDRAMPFVHAAGLDGTGPLVSTDGTVLFRADPSVPGGVEAIGRADRVLGRSPVPGNVYVLQPFGGDRNRPRVAELDGRTGRVVDGRPFPGFTSLTEWTPLAIVSAAGVPALLMSRPDGPQLDLALALDRSLVRGGQAPLRQIGPVGDLVGVATDRLLTKDRPAESCTGGDCHLSVITFTRDRVLSRRVEPPPGWSFGHDLVSSPDSDPLVVVTQTADPSQRALARVVSGGRRALIVPASVGVVPWLGMVPAAGGSVVFAVADPAYGARVVLWRPGQPSAVQRLDLPALRDGSQMLCVCR